MKINVESCTADSGPVQQDTYQKSVFTSEVKGVKTTFYEINNGRSLEFSPCKGRVSVYLLTRGEGNIRSGSSEFSFNEVALFLPGIGDKVQISSVNQDVGILLLELELTPDDQFILKKQQGQLPYFITYSSCKQYREAIKSEKTINRTLLPEDIAPRLCIGSVETTGPDQVDPHSHPMLEQFFFGLVKNDCVVKADNANADFKENELLHIPLGSEHGVTVDEGKVLHYIWVDVFGEHEDMSYIKDHHIEIDD